MGSSRNLRRTCPSAFAKRRWQKGTPQTAEFDLVIRNGTVVSSSGRRRADVAIVDGRIAEIAGTVDAANAADVIDATDKFVLPGPIDGHVHFREPGLEHEETWLTGSRAA